MKTGSRGKLGVLWLGIALGILGSASVPASAAVLQYEPSTQSLSILAGSSASFVLNVTCSKSGVEVQCPEVLGGVPNPIPASWVTASPTTYYFSTAGTKGFDVTITVPAGTASGLYTSRIRARVISGGAGNGSGCTTTVRVLARPTCGFTFSPAMPQVGQAVNFTDGSSDSDGSIVAWNWDFGDGGNSTQQNPTHAYASWGTYTVALTVTDNDGLTSTCSQQVTVLAKPSCSFSYTPANPVVAQTVQFTDGSSDPDGSVVAWDWDFGDGNGSSEQNPTHSYSSVGVYTVALTVTDDDGLTSTCSQEVNVAGFPMSAEFSWLPLAPAEGWQVVFQDLSVGCSGAGAITVWHWDFGDGVVSSVQNPGYVFADNGTYTVTLTVTDVCGRSAAVSKQVAVHNMAPVCDAGPNRQAVVGTPVVFEGQANDPGTLDTLTFNWDFGDGASASGPVVQHAYSAEGRYQVTLRVTDNDGAEGIATTLVQVWNGAIPGTSGQGSVLGTIYMSYSGEQVSGPDGRVMLSVHMTNPEADGESVGKWPDWVEFTVVDPNGVAIQRVYAEVRGQGGSEAGASAAVTLPPGAYLVWADAVDPDGRFRVASSRVPEPIAVGEATNAAWGASSGSDLGNACFAVAAWRLDSAQPNAQLICLIRDESGVQHVLWATGAEAVALDGGVLAVRGTCSVDGVHKVGFEATTNLSQGTFSLSLSGLWNVAGALDSLVTRVP